jgi:3-carboxy-cis,cis-muconate cycloisomerase
VTFGLKAAGWCDALTRAESRVAAAAQGLPLQLGGAAGTLAALGDRGLAVTAALGRILDLPVPALPWHAHRDRLAEVAAAIGIAAGTLGKIGRDLALLAQTEVGEAAEAAPGGSSTMPQKRNPIAASVAIAAAVRAPGLVATVLAAMPQEHERGIGGWQAEWETVPDLVRVTAGSARAIAEALATLQVDPERMRRNLAASNGLILAEAVGKEEAHRLVAAVSRRVSETGADLEQAVRSDPTIATHLAADEIGWLFRPESYLGSTAALIDRVIGPNG